MRFSNRSPTGGDPDPFKTSQKKDIRVSTIYLHSYLLKVLFVKLKFGGGPVREIQS
jgi:hypothetical protein